MSARTYKVLVYRVGNAPVVEDIEDTVEALQKLVGGYIAGHPIAPDVSIICNDEGKLDGLPPCALWLKHADTIVGNFVVSRCDAMGEPVDVRPEDVAEARRQLIPIKPGAVRMVRG